MYRAKELHRQQRYRDKSRYEPGVWNVNTVIMGGLGGDPDLSSSSEEGTCTYVCSLVTNFSPHNPSPRAHCLACI